MAYNGLVIRDVVFVHSLHGAALVRWHTRRHQHNSHEFHFFLGGRGRFENGNTTHSIRGGALFYSPPQVVHELHPDDPEHPMAYYAVLFDAAEDIAGTLADARFVEGFPIQLGTRQRLLFEDLKNSFSHPETYRTNAARHQLASFVYDLYARCVEGRRISLVRDEYSVHLDRAIAIFQRRIAEPVRLGEVAADLGITGEHLIRLFTQRFGVTPMQFFRRLKLETAGSLLINSDLSVKEISWRLGYANPFHFSRSFKTFTGASPQAFRRDYFLRNPMQYSTRLTGVDRDDPPRPGKPSELVIEPHEQNRRALLHR